MRSRGWWGLICCCCHQFPAVLFIAVSVRTAAQTDGSATSISVTAIGTSFQFPAFQRSTVKEIPPAAPHGAVLAMCPQGLGDTREP